MHTYVHTHIHTYRWIDIDADIDICKDMPVARAGGRGFVQQYTYAVDMLRICRISDVCDVYAPWRAAVYGCRGVSCGRWGVLYSNRGVSCRLRRTRPAVLPVSVYVSMHVSMYVSMHVSICTSVTAVSRVCCVGHGPWLHMYLCMYLWVDLCMYLSALL